MLRTEPQACPELCFVVEMVMMALGGGGGRTRGGEAAMSTVCIPSLLLGLVGCRSCISDEEALVDVHVATKCAVARARQRVFERLVMVVYGGGVAVPVRLRRFYLLVLNAAPDTALFALLLRVYVHRQ